MARSNNGSRPDHGSSPNGKTPTLPLLRAVELFAGVGGFRLGLERAGGRVVWSNQWEPTTKVQHASDCYVRHFGPEGHSNEDIATVLDQVEAGELELPQHDLLVGGFPCQDYSVARTLSQASGLEGRKGVLWWQIHRALRLYAPRFLLLENVDRLLKSPASQRGRDFAIMLASLAALGYRVEWRIVNAADYGFPQRRRRVFIVGEFDTSAVSDPSEWLLSTGVLAQALPVFRNSKEGWPIASVLRHVRFNDRLDVLSETFGVGSKTTPFANAGVFQGDEAWTVDLKPRYTGKRKTLGDVLQPEEEDHPSSFIPEGQLADWEYLKGAKNEPRIHRGSGFPYAYTEGSMAFPDSLHKPSRTILTGEGGPSPSRFKHVIRTRSGRLRRLTPLELERLNGFPDDWTTGHSDSRRAFLMGNALVVGLVERIAKALAKHTEWAELREAAPKVDPALRS
jgi:DNA (cytosine-5)-methyltransferase 1